MTKLLKLGSLADFVMGQAPASSDCNGEGRGVPFVKAGEFGDLRPIIREWTTDPLKLAKSTDVLICVVGATAGKLNLGADCAIGRSVAAIRPRTNLLDQRFLFHILKTKIHALRGGSQGSAQGVITSRMLNDIQVPNLCLSDQQRIASILDKADSVRRKRHDAIRLADEFLRAVYLDLAQRNPARVLVETLLAEVPNAARTGPFGSQLLVSEFTDTGIPVLGIDNVVSNAFTWAAPRFISPEKYAELERYTVRPGDVMVTIMGTTGRVAIAPDDLPTCISTKHLCTLTLDRKKMLPTYLWACLRWDPEVRAQTRREAKGAIMEGWNMGIVKGLLVNAPPMDVQLQFEEIANRIKRMSSAQALAAKGTDDLMASLSAKYLEPTT